MPPALDAVAMRCLAKVPAHSFASGKELAEALERISFGDEGAWYGHDIDALAFEPYGDHPAH